MCLLLRALINTAAPSPTHKLIADARTDIMGRPISAKNVIIIMLTTKQMMSVTRPSVNLNIFSLPSVKLLKSIITAMSNPVKTTDNFRVVLRRAASQSPEQLQGFCGPCSRSSAKNLS